MSKPTLEEVQEKTRRYHELANFESDWVRKKIQEIGKPEDSDAFVKASALNEYVTAFPEKVAELREVALFIDIENHRINRVIADAQEGQSRFYRNWDDVSTGTKKKDKV